MNLLLKLLLVTWVLVQMVSCNERRISSFEPLIDPRDGKAYQCKKIGSKVWMVENLAYETKDGESVYYGSNPEKYEKFGRLYFQESLEEACDIEGWHLPDSSEWMELLACYHLDVPDLELLNHKPGARWEGIPQKDLEIFRSMEDDGFNFQFGGLWHLKWFDPNSELQRSFEYMGQNAFYWAAPFNKSGKYPHLGIGRDKYNWIELSAGKPGVSYKGGEKFRFYIRLVKNIQ